MTVRLPGERTIVVDAKAPLTAYLDSVAATSDAERRNSLMRHSQQVAKHVDQLSNKAYWAQFQPAPEFVILFLPGDHFFSAALEYKPSLVEDAARVKILVATPSTLIAILKGVAYGWRQERMAANAEQIRQLAAELFDRFVTLQSHFGEIGRSLGKSVESFNRCVGSLETRVYPSLRRIRELGATAAEEPPPPEAIETVRPVRGIVICNQCARSYSFSPGARDSASGWKRRPWRDASPRVLSRVTPGPMAWRQDAASIAKASPSPSIVWVKASHR